MKEEKKRVCICVLRISWGGFKQGDTVDTAYVFVNSYCTIECRNERSGDLSTEGGQDCPENGASWYIGEGA